MDGLTQRGVMDVKLRCQPDTLLQQDVHCRKPEMQAIIRPAAAFSAASLSALSFFCRSSSSCFLTLRNAVSSREFS